MPKRSITTTQEFSDKVQAYADEHMLSWANALVTLASKQLGYSGEAAPKHGGDRRSKFADHPRYQEWKERYENLKVPYAYDPAEDQDLHQELSEAGIDPHEFLLEK